MGVRNPGVFCSSGQSVRVRRLHGKRIIFLSNLKRGRSKMPNCVECKFVTTEDEGKRHVCCRFPPAWNFLILPPKIIGQDIQVSTRSSQPGVNPDQWCGEFVAK
jgi:hypothetical protein